MRLSQLAADPAGRPSAFPTGSSERIPRPNGATSPVVVDAFFQIIEDSDARVDQRGPDP